MKRVGRHLFVVIVLALFCLAGFWQIHRLHERQAYNRTVRAAMAAPPVNLNVTPDAAPYRRVTGEGRYDAGNEILLRNQVHDDTSGNDVLIPFVLPNGRAVLVDTGWIPLGSTYKAPPNRSGTSIAGLALPPERKRPFSPDIPKTGRVDAINYVNVARVAKQLPYAIPTDFYVLLQRQRPAPKTPLYGSPPELTEGPHRGYAVQWFLFMLIGIVGYTAILRRERKRKNPPVGPAGSPGRL